MSLNTVFSSLSRPRLFWCVLGVAVFPVLLAGKMIFFPSPRDAMGWGGSFEERFSEDPLLGDHRYELSFTGDRARFEKFARRLGYANDQIRPEEYRKSGSDGQWSSGVLFEDENGKGKITYYSESN